MDDNLHDCLSLCGLNDAQITAIETEGFLTLSDFGNLRYTDVSEFTKKLSNLDDADGGVYFGQAIVIKLRALVYWLNDCDRRGLEPDVNSFDNNELKRMIMLQRMEADNPTTEKGDSTVKAPDKFHPESMRGWSVFKRQLENYLQNLLGVRKVPLAYVIRLDPPPEDLPDDKMTELIYQVPLEGDAYEIDNRKVYRIILDAVADTEAYAWIKEIRNQDGRGAMLKLRAHFDGKGPKSKRVILAEKKLEQLHYKNEMTFKFEKYCSLMKDCFDTIEEDYRHMPEKERVDLLLKNINCSQLESVITYISMDEVLCANFESAVNTLATRVAKKVFPMAELRAGQKRNVSEVTNQGNKGRGRGRYQRGGGVGRGNGRAGRGGGHNNNFGNIINGVDVSDPTRQFTAEEWAKIRQANAATHLKNLRRQRHGGRGRGGRLNNNITRPPIGILRNASETNTNLPDDMGDMTEQGTNERGGNAGNNFGSASYGGSSTGRNTSGGNVRFTSQVLTGDRREVKQMNLSDKTNTHANALPKYNTTGRSEIDNHADTCCIGCNFIPLYFTGKVCDVSGYLNTLPTQQNIEICSAATAIDMQDGSTIILVVNEGLWYGNQMDHSLLNPNQIRAFGNMVCDDPTDPYRSLGITIVNEDVEIPMTMRGSVCGFISRLPSEKELNTLPHVTLTSDIEWDPTNVKFRDSENPEDYGDIDNLRSISEVYVDSKYVQKMDQEVKVTSYDAINKIGATETRHRKPNISPEELSRLWNIGLETAKQTLKVTTQSGIRYASYPLTRRYRTERPAMRHRRLFDVFYTDILFSNVKSMRGAKCAQVICNDKFIKIYPGQSRKTVTPKALQDFIDDVGIPSEMVFDGAKEQLGPGSDFQKLLRLYKIRWNMTEPYTGKQNRAEPQIANLKRRWKRKMQEKNVPTRLWDYGIEWVADTMNLTSRGTDLNRRTGYELVTGVTPDISERLDFDFYDLCWYWDEPHADVAEDNRKIGRIVGVANRVLSDLSYLILVASGEVIARSTVQRVIADDLQQPEIVEKVRVFTEKISDRLDDKNHIVSEPDIVLYLQDEDITNDDVPSSEDRIKDDDDYTPDTYDEYLGAELIANIADEQYTARVIKRVKDDEGNPIGTRHDNPLLDTRKYEVLLSDGSTAEFTANVIAENIFAQCDSEGRQHLVFKEVIGHRKCENALDEENGYYVDSNGRKLPVRTSKGWDICVEWRDGSHSWLPLREVKNSNPVELAEYAIAAGIQNEPAFRWWVSRVLKYRQRIISRVKSRYWRTTHKFGIRLPKSVAEALEIDRLTGTDHWRRAIEKEMKNVRVAFEKWEDGTVDDARSNRKLVGYQEIPCHMIFDIKMDGQFTRKARFVAGGHMTEPPVSITYSSVVSRDSVRIAFMLAALNDLKIVAADIGNAYLNAPCREKVWTIAGKEFGSDEGSVMLIKRALYGLKTSGAAWRATFAAHLKGMKFKPSLADPDVWIRPAVKKESGQLYYEYLLVYVDDILCISEQPDDIMNEIKKMYRLKDESVGEPKRYLGATIGKHQLPDGLEVYSMSAKEYITSAVKNVEDLLASDPQPSRLKQNKVDRPMKASYRPEIDISEPLNEDLSSRYQNLIGILRWAVELGRIDILTPVAMLSQHNAYPRKGHLEAVYHVFAYLKKHSTSKIVFDPSYPELKETQFPDYDWTDFYGDAKEELPPHMPEPRGMPVQLTCFWDSDHAGNLVTRRSHTGVLVFVNKSPVIWYSKRQNTVESSTFGSEFVAGRTAVDLVVALRYKLRMFGVPIDGPAKCLCDNQAVVKNSSIPSSTLNKKHNAICYHRIREAVASGIIKVGKEDTTTNLADLFTKTTHTTPQFKFLLERIVYNG